MSRSRPIPVDPGLDRLSAEATRIRRAIEMTPPAERAGMLAEFPRECCDHAMRLLALHLARLGFSGLVRAKGERPSTGSRHVWLECAGVILDITADQFGEGLRPVIVTRRSRWHEAWKPTHEPITEELLTRWRDADPGIYEVYRTYRTILEKVPEG